MTLRRLGKKKAAALALAGKPWPRSTITASRKAPRKRKRKPSETLRIYGGKKRIEFVKSLPCAACGIQGYSTNAHLTPVGEKGTGYKGDAQFIAPLCGPRYLNELSYEVGCHHLYDRQRWLFDARFPDFNSEQAARQCERAWQDHLTGE